MRHTFNHGCALSSHPISPSTNQHTHTHTDTRTHTHGQTHTHGHTAAVLSQLVPPTVYKEIHSNYRHTHNNILSNTYSVHVHVRVYMEHEMSEGGKNRAIFGIICVICVHW